jgi:hypothetical protein
VIDGKLVAIDNDGRPDFNLLQSYRSSDPPLTLYLEENPTSRQELRQD